jgi:hypothetical protein
VVVYIDDILIYSATHATHVTLVCKVLGPLLEHELYVKAEKGVFSKQAVSFLGYHISTSGVVMECDRIAAVRNWPTPTMVKEVQWFLGLANYYQMVYLGFWAGGCSRYLTAEGGASTFAVVDRGGQSFWSSEGVVYRYSHIGTSGRCFSTDFI